MGGLASLTNALVNVSSRMRVMKVQEVPLAETGFISLGPRTRHRQPLFTSMRRKSLRLRWQLIAGLLLGGTSTSSFIQIIPLRSQH